MNKAAMELVDRFQVEPEAAVRILSLMEIDFSECTQQEFDAEALRVYESLVAEEFDGKKR